MTSGPAFRLARAAVFAAVCVSATATGHALMSATALPWWAVGYAGAATTAAAWWLTGRERGGRAVTGATVVTQLTLHELFALAQKLTAPTADSPMTDMGAMPMPEAHGHLAFMSPGSTTGMFLAHVAAAVVCGLWLWRGEAAAYRTGRALAAALFVPLRRALGVPRVVAVPGRPPRAGLFAAPRRLRTVLLQHVVSRRGPPRSPVLM
ncbi:hypothetical protein [Streptomyces sp. cg35]|uniref:hypothetical protein n=1 Tax=Streptomyces sp. cg35 TaxID=3421650 RepID=UPI003D181DA2